MSPFALLIVLILGNGVILVIGDEGYIPYTSTHMYTFEPHYRCSGRGVMNITRITYGRCCCCWHINWSWWCRESDLPETSTTYKYIISECHTKHSCRYIDSRNDNNCDYVEDEADARGLDFDYYFVYFTCNLGPVDPTETAQTLTSTSSTSSSSNNVTVKWMVETLPGGEEFTFPVSNFTRPQETTTVSEVPTAAASSGSVDVPLVAGVTVGVAVLVIAAAVLAAIFVCRKRGRKEPKPAVRTDNVYSGSPTGGKTETGPSVNLQSQLGQAFYTNHDDELVIHDNANYATHGNVMTLAENGGDDLVIQDNINYAAHGDVMTPDDNSKDDLVIQDNIHYASHGDVMDDDLVVEDNMNYAAY